jgi:S-adenosylmethionine-dependent methyltransferase
LPVVLEKVTPGGLFSLAFYNRNSLIYRNLLQGNFRKIKKDNWQQSSTGLTPKHPVDPEQLFLFMVNSGFEALSKRGIRCFYDFMRERVKQERSYEDVLEMERKYSQREPFMSLARYIHVIWRRTAE